MKIFYLLKCYNLKNLMNFEIKEFGKISEFRNFRIEIFGIFQIEIFWNFPDRQFLEFS